MGAQTIPNFDQINQVSSYNQNQQNTVALKAVGLFTNLYGLGFLVHEITTLANLAMEIKWVPSYVGAGSTVMEPVLDLPPGESNNILLQTSKQRFPKKKPHTLRHMSL